MAITRDGAHDPRAIANKILDICNARGKSLTLMQLIKLVYLADGWSMALRKTPMSKHNPQAWQYGPVYPTVYKAFKKFGNQPITDAAKINGSDIPIEEDFTADEVELITAVIDAYGNYHAFQLSNIMHKPGTPWTETFNSSGSYSEIPVQLMADHFEQIAKERTAA